MLEPIRIELHLNDQVVAFLTGVPLGVYELVPIPGWQRSNRRNILAPAC